MPYQTLGSRAATGAADTTGQNPGNWTVQFAPKDLAVTVTEFEVYKIVVTKAAQTATFDVFVDSKQWDTSVYATNNSWDPSQPLIVRYGETIYFFYSTAASDGKMPHVTIWLRHEVSLSQVFGL
ncbi:MAG TPA: hypothetical protein VGA04_26780 [Streptosporangiaceae bacterium]